MAQDETAVILVYPDQQQASDPGHIDQLPSMLPLAPLIYKVVNFLYELAYAIYDLF